MNEPQNQTAYPLAWPPAWKRTEAHRRADAPFFTSRGATLARGKRSMSEAAEEVIAELGRLGATAIVISTNVELRKDGLPYSDRRAPADPGAAVYFKLKGRPIVLACDKWRRVEDNLWAIGKHIEALRGQERWGVGNVEQAFAGYLRLAAPGESGAAAWYSVLGCAANASFEEARAAYLVKAKASHPDIPGGSHDAMRLLNTSWDQARQHFAGG